MQTTGGVTLLDIYRRLYPKTLLADITLARAGGGGVMHPHEFFFLELPSNGWADLADILHSLWGILCVTFDKKYWPGQVRSPSYDVIRGTASDRFLKKIVFSVT